MERLIVGSGECLGEREEDFYNYSKQVQTFDRLTADLPERVWLE